MNPALISRIQKDRFLLKLSEDEFRDRVVRPLLLLKGFHDGRDLCGPTEQGKDAIFFEYDKLGVFELSAVQTKKGSVNLAAKAADSLVNLVAQLRTAGATAYALLKPTRAKVRPSKIYLVASGKINDSARRYCVDEVRDTMIRFLDCDDLVPWIDEHMPQLWLDMDANVLTYLGALEKQLTGHEGPFATQFLPIDKSLASTCFSDASVTVFVRKAEDPSDMVRRKAASKRGLQKKKDEATFPLYAIPTKPFKKVLLLGDGGSGKTTGLLQIVYRTAKASLENAKVDLIPVLVKATDIVAASPKELVDYLDDRSRELSLQKKPVFGLADLDAGRVCVFIDGLDEVGTSEGREMVASLAVGFCGRFSKCCLTITSRPYEFLADIKELESFERLTTTPITWKDAERILDLAKTGKNIGSAITKESLSRLAKIQGFSLNPLMVSVYAATANFDLQDVPPNVTELFKRFTEQMLGRWDEQKGLKNLHRPLVKDFAVCSLAFHMHAQNSTTIGKDEAKRLIAGKLQETGHHEDGHTILQEVLDRSGLFRDFGGEISFRHHMFQEYFAGRAIPSDEFAAEHASNSWWRRSIVFFFGDNPRNAAVLKDFIDRAVSRSPAEQFSAVCTVGLALQACYLSSVKIKVEIWKSLLEALVRLKGAFIADHDELKEMPTITAFSYYYLYRDSLALSNISESLDHIRAWTSEFAEQRDELVALTLFSLMRLGRFDLISREDIAKLVGRVDWYLISAVEFVEGTMGRPLGATQLQAIENLKPVLAKDPDRLFNTVMQEVELQTQKHKLVQDTVAERTLPREQSE